MVSPSAPESWNSLTTATSKNQPALSKPSLYTQISILHVRTYLFLMADLGGFHDYYTHFTDEKNKAHTGEATCPKFVRKKQSQGVNPGGQPRACSLPHWGGPHSQSFLSRSHTVCCADMSQMLPSPCTCPTLSPGLQSCHVRAA